MDSNIDNSIREYGRVDELVDRYPRLSVCRDSIIAGYEVIRDCYRKGGKLLIAGNGGSAADAEHISGELMKRFKLARPLDSDITSTLIDIDPVRGKHLAETLEMPFTAIPLVAHEALTTAFMNDSDSMGVFAQQLLGFGREGDVFLAISTSGNSENIIHAAILAKAIGINVIGLTGVYGGVLLEYSDICICAPATETYIIQEFHLPIYHCICLMLEEYFWGREELF